MDERNKEKRQVPLRVSGLSSKFRHCISTIHGFAMPKVFFIFPAALSLVMLIH
jgi:hypothetical protein